MDILLNPNIAYLFLAGGIFFTVTAILSPGTGLLELAALVTLIVAGYEVVILPVNWWSIVILLIGLVLFYLAVFKTNSLKYLAASIIALIIGSTFMFHDMNGWNPSVNPLLAIVVSTFLGIYFWITAKTVILSEKKTPIQDPDALIGQIGKVKEAIPENDNGTILVGSELWSALSDKPIPEGKIVRVIGRNGFILKVEEIIGTETESQRTGS